MMNLNRRAFISALSLSTGYLLFRNPVARGKGPLYPSADPFQRVKLGNSGLQTSLLGMGTGVHAGNRSSFLSRQEAGKSVAVLRHAYDRGCRFFDCADTYGTHSIMSQALRELPRDQITLTSKIWVRKGGIPEPERPDADVVVDRFRKELNTGYIDLVQIHCMVNEGWTDNQKRQMDILDDLKSKGVIKAHGVSVHSLEAMKAAVESDWVDVIHVRINPYGIAMDKPEPEEVVEVIHRLHHRGKGVIGMKLVGNGAYQEDERKLDHTIRFVLGLGSVDMAIVGFQNKEQIDDYTRRMNKALTAMT